MLHLFGRHAPVCLAHRGASSLAPENTLIAGTLAAELGADAWEVDVCLSADGVPVVIHDDTLKRTTDVQNHSRFAPRKPWPVHAFTLEELQTLDAGSWFCRNRAFRLFAPKAVVSSKVCQQQRIPTLQQVLELSLRLELGLNIELKEPPPEAGGDAVRELVQAAWHEVRVLEATKACLLSSFAPEVLEQARGCAPELPRALLLNKKPESLEALLQELERLQAVAVHPKAGLLSKKAMQTLRQRGYLVNVWLANTTREMQRQAKAGASGIFTDFPQRCPQSWKRLEQNSDQLRDTGAPEHRGKAVL